MCPLLSVCDLFGIRASIDENGASQLRIVLRLSQIRPKYGQVRTRYSARRATDRWAVPLLTFRVRHTWDHERPSRLSAATWSASTWARGLPNFLPFARAFRRPALTRSWISDRSNSAMSPMIWNIRRPDGVLRSRLSRKLMKATPYAQRSANAFTRCFSERPKRSIFQTK